MHSLIDALDSFNQKERNLLVRKILGQEGSPRLSKRFRDQVAQTLVLQSIPEEAWWATDYHISWLAGALALFEKGEAIAKEPCLNPIDDRWPNKKKPAGRQLVEGNQEDVDLVIATGCDLILIEAKAYGAWDEEQLHSKLARLHLLHDFYTNMARTTERPKPINFHFLLISPDPLPDKIKLSTCWPSWALKGQKIPWISLEKPSVFEVTRCDCRGRSDAEGGSWHITGLRHRREPTASAVIV